MVKENLAAIDLGTNSCRIKITDGFGNVIYREAVTTKLGEGMYANMRFTDEAIFRGIDCLSKYAELLEDYEVKKYRAIATASCRMASNGMDFVNQVRNVCGIQLDVIDGREEAILNLRGAQLNADKNAEYILVYDLGGGSTEITLATNTNNPEILHTVSIPWGARNSSEAFAIQEYNFEQCQRLKKEIEKYVSDFMQSVNFSDYRDSCCCISTSSTPLRLVNMVHNTEEYSKDYADGMTVSTKDIDVQIEKTFSMSVKDMTESLYIGGNRAPIFIAACTIFKTIYDTLQISSITASLKGAQEAIIQELMNNG